MADQTLPEIIAVHEKNKAIRYRRKQDAIFKIQDLLKVFSKRELIKIIEDEVDNG